jgi:hypothetical protein
VSLARLWERHGRGATEGCRIVPSEARARARELLAGIYGWFTEGFDTVELVGAKALQDLQQVKPPKSRVEKVFSRYLSFHDATIHNHTARARACTEIRVAVSGRPEMIAP